MKPNMMLLSQMNCVLSCFGLACSMFGSYLWLSNVQFRRVIRPWLGLKMLDLNPMVIAQLKERSGSFPDVRKGVLVPMVSYS